MQMYFHSLLWSYFPWVPIILITTVSVKHRTFKKLNVGHFSLFIMWELFCPWEHFWNLPSGSLILKVHSTVTISSVYNYINSLFYCVGLWHLTKRFYQVCVVSVLMLKVLSELILILAGGANWLKFLSIMFYLDSSGFGATVQ